MTEDDMDLDNHWRIGPDRPSPSESAAEKRAARKDEREEQARAELREHIRRIVDAAPPLTPEQRDRLRVLLHPTREKR